MKIIKILIFLLVPLVSFSQEKEKVLILEIKNEIDPRMNRYIKLGLEEAEESGTDLIIVDMDTYGGYVNDAKDIIENLLDTKIPVWVFINKDAASAGALISIACDSIYMSAGASIGAATVVMGQGEAAPDKYQSYMRSTMRSTAEVNNRDPKIAEAMVDENIEIEGVTKKGEVITFSTSEAIKFGFCEGQRESIEEILEKNGVTNYDLATFELDFVEKTIAFVINPFISGILVLIIIGGIYFELQTPGVGFPIAAAGVALIVYLIPYYLNGLAESWEILAFIIGILFIAAEIFIIPGFGIAGIIGIILSIGSLTLIMLNNDAFDFSLVPFSDIFTALITTFGGIIGAMLLMLFGGVKLTDTKYFRKIALTSTQARSDGFTSSFIPKDTLLGKTGIAYTVLRPSGKIEIEGEIFDASTRGDYIEKGEKVLVIGDEGTSLKVRKNK